jgi:sulfur transfer complex TusBCD TusB component (DsrH family)
MSKEGQKFESLGIIITKTAYVRNLALDAVNIGENAQKAGKKVGVFLFSDGIWIALKGSGTESEKLNELISKGAQVFASDEHAVAGGFPKERALEGVKFVEDSYGVLVDQVMEEWDKVIIC